MAERVKMLHGITGAAMSVPAELVPTYKKLGHKLAQQVEAAEEVETAEQSEAAEEVEAAEQSEAAEEVETAEQSEAAEEVAENKPGKKAEMR